MKILITGTSGYIGGSIAQRLIEHGHHVLGLVRNTEKATALEARGIQPIPGTLDDTAILLAAAREADGVINTASADHRPAVEALAEALAGSGKPFIHTSGSSIVADDARGDVESPNIFHDESWIQPTEIRAARVAIDRFVRTDGIERGFRSIVICPTMIYGEGRGLTKDSDQLPKLIARARVSGCGSHIGKGINRWSNVFLGDLVDLYLLALQKAPSGSFFFAENGESSFKELAESISRALGFEGNTESWKAEDAIGQFGDAARFALGSNSRVRGINARRLLGWSPYGPSITEVISEIRNPKDKV